MTLALPFFLALLLSAALVPICRLAALRLGYTVPAVDGDPRARPKARFGGIAIVAALLLCAAAIGAAQAVPVLVACSVFLFVVGIVGDIVTLKPSTKLVAIIAVASVFLYFDTRLYWSESLTIDSLVTLFWIVGITSAFNLLDNMDGLCGGIALIAGTAFLLTLLPLPLEAPALQMQYLVVLLGAIAGFLLYNIHPASVTMGEAGSLVIGVHMAAMTLQIAPGRGSDLLSIVAVPALVLLIPIFDATLVAVSRFTADASEPWQAHNPSSHRLIAMGLSERTAVGLLWVLAAASGAVAVMASRYPQVSGLLAAIFTIAMALFAIYLAQVRILQDVDPTSLPATVRPLGVDLGYRRRLVEVVLDLLLVSVAYYGAFRLRFDASEWAENFAYFRQSFPIVLGIQIVTLFAMGAYRGMWRYFSLSDSVTFVKAVLVGIVTAQVAILYLHRFEGYSPEIFIEYGAFLLLLLVGSRASFRLISDFIHRQRSTGRRLLVYGAGDAGSIAVRHLMNDPRSTYRIVGFIDDDVDKRNIRVHGYRVVGGHDHLVGMVMAAEVDAVAVTDDSQVTESLAWLCARHGVTLHHVSIDWRDIPVAEARIVRLAEARRQWEPSSTTPVPFQRSVVADHAPRASVPVERLRRTEPIRVAHVITRLILGGAQENTLYTAIGQHRDPRFDVTLVCGVDEAGEGNMFSEATRAGVSTVVLPSLVREIRPLSDLKSLLDLYLFLRRGSYAIVHTHSSKAGILGRIAARAAGVPVVVHTIHGVAFHEFQSVWKNRLYIALERLCAPLSDRIISVSQRLSDAAVAHGIGRREQHVTIFSGIELDLFLSIAGRLSVADAKRQAGIPPDAPVVGKIARLFPLKGHDQFLAAAAAIARQMPEVHFLLVGDGPLRDQLRADAERLGIGDRLVMAGRVAPDRVPEYIQSMDVVVHTSLREGIARVLPQAGAVGKPVVTFELDGAPEVIRDGVSGYLVPPVDTDGIAARTVELLRDPERREQLGEAGRRFAEEHFSVDRMVDRINALYLERLARLRRTTAT